MHYRWMLTELPVGFMPVSAATQAWPGKWIRPESLLTLWVRAPCYWSTDITAGALGQTQRHKSNYENKPTQLSQLRTLHKASFDECLEVHAVYFPSAAELMTTKLIIPAMAKEGVSTSRSQGRCESHVTQTEWSHSSAAAVAHSWIFWRGNKRVQTGSAGNERCELHSGSSTFNNSDCEKGQRGFRVTFNTPGLRQQYVILKVFSLYKWFIQRALHQLCVKANELKKEKEKKKHMINSRRSRLTPSPPLNKDNTMSNHSAKSYFYSHNVRRI